MTVVETMIAAVVCLRVGKPERCDQVRPPLDDLKTPAAGPARFM
jgi:hypothetical protein